MAIALSLAPASSFFDEGPLCLKLLLSREETNQQGTTLTYVLQ